MTTLLFSLLLVNVVSSVNDSINHKNSKTIDLFKKSVMDKNGTVRDPTFVVRVLNACHKSGNALFAEEVCNYITKQDIRHFIMEPNQLIYSLILSVYQKAQTVDVSKCIRLVETWMNQYTDNRASLHRKRSTQPVDSPVILNQVMKIILFRSNWDNDTIHEHITRYYRHMVRLQIEPDADTIRLLGLIHYADGSKTFGIFDDLQSYLLTKFKAWIQPPNRELWNDIRRLFNTFVIEAHMVVTSHVLVELVFDACIKLKAIAFAEKVWEFVINPNTTNCQIKPNGMMYYKLLCVYKSADIVDIDKCFKLTNEWVDQYRKDKESLKPKSNQSVFQYSEMLTTMMHVALWRKHWSLKLRLTHARGCYYTMIDLGIQPDHTTRAILEQIQTISMIKERAMNSIITHELECYLWNSFTHLLQLSDSHYWGVLIKLFDGLVIEQQVVLKDGALVELVLDACFKLKDIEFGSRVWSYIMSHEPQYCLRKPTQLLYSKMMDLYATAILVTNYEAAMGVTDDWIYQYQVDRESLNIDALVTGQWECDNEIITKMMNILIFKTGSIMSESNRTNQIGKYLNVLDVFGCVVTV
eukprot:242699_1